MLYSVVIVGLLANIATSSSLYNKPADMEVDEACAFPANFTIDNFKTYLSKTNGTSNRTSFHFVDSGTGIDTLCERNSSSVTSSTDPDSTPRWPCNNRNVEFIYQEPGLTLLEAACPGSSSTKFEASGLAELTLNCASLSNGTYCTTTPSLISDNFTSLEPRPQ